MQNFPLNCLENSLENLKALIKANRDELAQLLKQEEKTYAGFVRPFMESQERVSVFFTPIAHLQSVKNSEASQEAFVACIGELTAYTTELSLNREIYGAFTYIRENEYDWLDTASKKVIDDAILGFELEGVNLPDDKKERMMAINIRLSELSNDFSQNILNATNAYTINITDESVLGEMPESDKSIAKSDTGWTFTLQMPSYTAFMTYVTDRGKREEVYRAYSTRAPQNGKLIGELLALRAEKAEMLGCRNYAELNLKSMSAPSVDAVLDFLIHLAKVGKPHAENDLNELRRLAEGDGIKDFQAYDAAYYSEKLRKAKYDFDEEELRPYFEKESVVNCLFSIINRLFGIEFKKQPAELWNEKAEYYAMYTRKPADGLRKPAGGLYLDLEARSDKRGGAWMQNWHSHHTGTDGKEYPSDVFVAANFPVSKGEQPSLLRHNDVTTLFHEMGHALHHLLSTVDEINVSGVNGIDWDTVEFPSQFLENFAYAPQVLGLIAKHHKTNEPMPAELMDKLTAARNFQAGMALVRQIEFGLFDMRIHLEKMDENQVQQCLDGVRREVAVIIPPGFNKFQNGFSHIFGGGYAAGYYSYKWAEMLAADAYCAFEDASIFDDSLAKSYLDTVLSLGASLKMDEIYRMFLGRDPDPEAILRLAGLTN